MLKKNRKEKEAHDMSKFWKIAALCALLILPASAASADDGTLTLPAGLTVIEEEAFYGVISAEIALVPEGTVTVGARAFAEGGFSEIRLPATVTEIGEGAFRNCGKASDPLRYYCIPSGISVGAQAFAGCRAAIYIDGRELPYFTYTIQDNSVTITGLSGSASIQEAVIPDTIEGKPVTAIAASAFSGRSTITRIVIPSTVTSIGNSAFRSCSTLTDINLPAALTSIGNNAFRDCRAITQIEIPAGITEIAQDTFSGAQSLQRVVLPEGLNAIGATAFCDCYALVELNIPSTVTQIGNKAFSRNQALTQVTIPAGITSLTDELFYSCSSLESVSLPNSLSSIGEYVFSGCTKLTDVNFPAGLSSIGKSAFENACRNQPGYPVYSLPDSLAALGQNAFNGCGAALCVTRGGELEALLKESGNTLTYYDRLDYRYQYKKVDNIFTLYLTGYAGAGGNVVIPAGPVVIGENAFKGNTALTGVTIPSGVTKIDRWAFENCSALGSVSMADSVLTIEDAAFRSCADLTDVAFPASLTKIGSDAFDYACTVSGTHYYNLPDDLAEFGWTPFSDCGAVLCVTRGSSAETLVRGNQYGQNYTHPGETDFRYRYDSSEGLERLMQYTGTGNASVSVPAYVWLIDDNAFLDHTELTQVNLPETVTRINSNAFRGCTNLTDISLPDSLAKIYDNAFNGCGSAAGGLMLELPPDITEMGSSGVFDASAILVCNKESATASTISNHGYSFVRSDRPEETDLRYKKESAGWSLYDYTGSAASVRLPDDCVNVSSARLGQKVTNGLELVCAQLSDTADGLSAAGLNFTFPGHKGLRYRLIDGVLYIMGYAGGGTQIIIPEAQAYVQDGNHDIQIRAGAFQGLSNITKVVIPEGVTRINDSAFKNCYNLTDITFPDTLKTMDQNAFVLCGRDSQEDFYFVLPDYMEDLAGRGGGANTFGDCNAILMTGKESATAALLTDRNYDYTAEGEEDFRYRYIAETVNGETVRRLWLVGYTGNAATVNIPEGIYGIRRFDSNTTATNWHTFYGDAFYGNQAVTKVVIPEGTEVIEDSAFMGTVNLTDVTFPSTLKVLKNHAFEKCGKNADTLHYYVLPDEMTEISTNTAAGWGAFTDVNLGRVSAAPGTSTALQLSDIDTYYHNGSYRFALKGHETDGLLYHYRTYTTDEGSVNRLVLEQYEGSGDEVAIPAGCGIYAIGDSVFSGRTDLQKVIIPYGIEQIGANAFDGCTMLHDGEETNAIVLPGSVKSIGNLAFRDLGAAYTAERFFLVLPSSLNEFDLGIFTNCNAVLVAPEGSYAANVLYTGWYQYYNTLEDARAQRNIQKRTPEEGQTVTYSGRP